MALPQQHEKDSVGNGAEATSKLASYEPPKSGLLSRVPPSWVPYGELMRINKPAGIYLVYFHHLFGTLYGACVSEVPPSLSRLVFINVVLFIGSIFERSAGCAWNDYIDQDIDRKVTRTRLRPIARGAISTMQAFFLTLSLALLCLGCMQLLPSECLLTSVPAQILLLLYPYAKRVTNVPSAVLGSQLALGIVLGMTAMGCGPLNAPELWDGKMWTAIGTFYLANVVWIVFCDSIYSHQDIKDDLKAGT
jgi:4-hydroxybenzoate polyprenyltransferase